MLTLLSWNIARRDEAWRVLLDVDADVALLQEAAEPPAEVARRLGVDSAPWQTVGAGMRRPWRTAVVRLSDRCDVQGLEPKSLEDAKPGELGVSRLGTLAAAVLTAPGADPVMVASMYAPWERPHDVTGGNWIYADASVHRAISDLSALVGQQAGHRIIAAGDLNILRGYGEEGSPYWAARYATVFERMAALGLHCIGPQAPAGRQAHPWPQELPTDSLNVPTYHTSHQGPLGATRQLDFVFASAAIGDQVRARALNEPHGWGPSDHCRIEITID